MLPSRFVDLVNILLYVAKHSGERAVSGRKICEALGHKSRYFEPWIQQLVKDGYLHSAKGPKGGYSLVKEKRKILMGELYIKSLDYDLENSSIVGVSKELKKIVDIMGQDVLKVLNKYTLDDLWEETNRSDSSNSGSNFTI